MRREFMFEMQGRLKPINSMETIEIYHAIKSTKIKLQRK